MADFSFADQQQNAALEVVLALLQADARSWAAQLRGIAKLLAASGFGLRSGAGRQLVKLEVAGSWRVGQLTASRLMYEADRMAQALPRTLSLLAEGALRARPAGRN